MVEHKCIKCGKTFSRKSNYDYHITKKFDCSPKNNNHLEFLLQEIENQKNKITELEKKIEQLIINNIQK